ncbi:MAG: DUF3309 domain-containing protein [Natronospirillum sp.]|uniref:DUF3309 family protein n=1 Tax=Natronospirillum sp. TaxID=2812955 RepID=UPI0025F2895C|nr:DUF3309 family protein [Natronospirillum sp.]MCH8551681.1 DUF3309 domain-containing protein [Natronospirillum sp.]
MGEDRLVEPPLMNLAGVLLVALMLILISVMPVWPHTRHWGYLPSGVTATVVLVMLLPLLGGTI